MRKFKSLFVLLVASSCTLLTASSLHAEDFPERQELDERSRQEGVGTLDVPLLQRQAGVGMAQIADSLLAQFSNSNDAITTDNVETIDESEERILSRGDGWALRIYGDGTQVKYWNNKYLRSSNNPKVDVDERLTNSELEQLGREFIESHLQEYITLAPNEELVPFHTKHHVRSGQSTSGGPITRQVISSAVVFSRTVDGIHVVGPGSKVAIIFANDGTPAGFELEWANYNYSDQSQELLSIDEIYERSSAMSTMELSADEVELKRFECGYYDAGIRHRDSDAPVQTACISHYIGEKVVGESSSGPEIIKSAVADAIPMAVDVEPDTSWPQAMQLCTEGDVCDSSPLAEELPKTQ